LNLFQVFPVLRNRGRPASPWSTCQTPFEGPYQSGQLITATLPDLAGVIPEQTRVIYMTYTNRSEERSAVGTVVDDAASEEFHAFFERHYAELSRLAHLLRGEADAADDLAADALLALWHRWDRVRAADHPAAYARGVVANLARTRIRSAVRERRRVALFWSQREEKTENPDVAGVVDVQEALRRLPFRKRACVVLRHAFDLSEKDTALALGVSVGTVKSQTSKGMAELQRLLGPQSPPLRMHAALARGGESGGRTR
jgi:RNA polymerase sigma-70 factor (sigma-E family)